MTQKTDRLRTPKPVRKLPESQSKFDRWLERQVEARKPIPFVFARHPIVVFARHPIASHAAPASIEFTCKVIEVDRYMVLLEFDEGETWWTSKANILSAGFSV